MIYCMYQFIKCVRSDDFIDVSILRDFKKYMFIRASQCNKAYILTSKKAFDNCFLYAVPKLWNTLPNNINGLDSFD